MLKSIVGIYSSVPHHSPHTLLMSLQTAESVGELAIKDKKVNFRMTETTCSLNI